MEITSVAPLRVREEEITESQHAGNAFFTVVLNNLMVGGCTTFTHISPPWRLLTIIVK